MNISIRQTNVLFRFVTFTILILLIVLAIFYFVMQPQLADLREIAFFLSITTVITLLASQLAYKSGWINRAPSLRWSLFGTYVLSSILTFINVWLTADLMFVSPHDLLLGTILLVFASGIGMTMGYFFTETLAHRIMILNKTASQVRRGGLGARVTLDGRDEIAELGESFNEMLEQLEISQRKQQELDAFRRELIAWISHDLQTPLASIRAIVEALADGMVEDEETQHRYLLTATRDIQSLSSLIDDLFELAQLDAGGLQLDLQSNALSDLISDTSESFSALAKQKGLTLEADIKGDVDSTLIDVKRIGRVLNNLVSNAIRHTPPGGEIKLSARNANGGVELIVSDNGEGFNPQDLPYLFDRFYRGEKSRSRSTGGVGLGLAIAKGFVETHGGQIRAEGKSEGGARFVIWLPASN